MSFTLVGRTIGPAQPAFWRPESSPVAGCRFRETHVRILPSYMEAGCTESGTANCAGLSVPNFMLLTARRFRLKNLHLWTPHALHVAVDFKCICLEAV